MYLLKTVLLSLIMSINVLWAKSSITKGDYELHYNVFPSTFITPEVAKAYKIKRSKSKGMMNLSVVKNLDNKNTGVEAEFEVMVNNLLGQRKKINLKKISENDGAIYYIAVFDVSHREVVNFNILAKPKNAKLRLEVKFNKEFYTD